MVSRLSGVSNVGRTPMLVTALVPHIGYDRANTLLKEFAAGSDKNLKEFLIQKLGKELIEKGLLVAVPDQPGAVIITYSRAGK